MSTVLTDVAELKGSPQFQEWVEAVASGEANPEQEAGALRDLGQRLLQEQATALARQEVQEAVDYRKPRRAARQLADELPERQARRQAACAARDEAQVEMQETLERLAKRVQVLAEQAHSAEIAEAKCYAAVKYLQKSYRGPLTAELAAIHEQGRQLADELAGIKEARGRTNWWLSGPPMIRASVKPEQQRKLRARLTEADEKIARLEAASEENRQQAAEIERAMLQP